MPSVEPVTTAENDEECNGIIITYSLPADVDCSTRNEPDYAISFININFFFGGEVMTQNIYS